MGKEKSFVFYTKYESALRDLTAAQQGKILMSCIQYVTTGTVPEIKSQAASMLFKLIRQDIDEDKRKYEEVCAKRRENANKRYEGMRSDANGCNSMQMHASVTDKDKEKDKDIYKGIYNTRTHARTKFSNFEERDPAEAVAKITKIGGAL